MSDFVNAMLAIVAGVLGLAIVSVLVSQKAQTSSVIQASGSALSNVIAAAVNPVTGTGASGSSGVSSVFSPSTFSNGLNFLSNLNTSAGVFGS